MKTATTSHQSSMGRPNFQYSPNWYPPGPSTIMFTGVAKAIRRVVPLFGSMAARDLHLLDIKAFVDGKAMLVGRAQWLKDNQITLDHLPSPTHVQPTDHETILMRQRARTALSARMASRTPRHVFQSPPLTTDTESTPNGSWNVTGGTRGVTGVTDAMLACARRCRPESSRAIKVAPGAVDEIPLANRLAGFPKAASEIKTR